MSTADRIIAQLSDLRIEYRDATSTRYRCNSPFRANADSLSFVLTVSSDGEHGCWYDHVSGEHGSLYELAERLGVPVSARPTTLRAQTVDEYANAHGVTAQVLFNAGWRFTVRNGRKALAIPTATGIRYRYLDGAKPKFDQPHGYTPCWYRLDEAIAIAARINAPLVLCNGEPSVVVAQHYGVPATCITSSGERLLPQSLLEELLTRWPGPIIVALDSDAKGRDVAPRLVAQLTQADRQAMAVDLGGWNGYDLADFCANYRYDSLSRLRERARAAARAERAARAMQTTDPASPPASVGGDTQGTMGLRVYWGDEIDTIPAPVDLVRGYLTLGTVALLIAPPESGKSTVAVDLACRVAQQHHVLYLAAEASSNVRLQLVAWQQHHGGRLDRVGVVIDPVNLLDLDHLAALRAIITAHHVRLVVVDTLSAAAPQLDENTNAVAALIADLNELARSTSCTILLLHHPTKSSSTTYRGHSSLLANTNTAMIIERMAPDDPVIKLSVVRHRGTRAEQAWFRLTPVEMRTASGDVVQVPVIEPTHKRRGDTLTSVHYAVLEYLRDLGDEGATTGEITADVAGVVQCSAATLRAVIADLLRASYIAADGGGRRTPKVLTAKGRQVLTQRDDAHAQHAATSPFIVSVELPAADSVPAHAPAPTPAPAFASVPSAAVVLEQWRKRLPQGWGMLMRGDGVALMAPSGVMSPLMTLDGSTDIDHRLALAYATLLHKLSAAPSPPMAD